MTKFLQFLMDGLRLMAWLILMLTLSIIFFVFIMPNYQSLPPWLAVIANPVLTSTLIVLVVTSFCWVFRLKVFSKDNPPDWYEPFERLFNFRSFSNFLRGIGYIVLVLFLAMCLRYIDPPDMEKLPEAPVCFGQTHPDSN